MEARSKHVRERRLAEAPLDAALEDASLQGNAGADSREDSTAMIAKGTGRAKRCKPWNESSQGTLFVRHCKLDGLDNQGRKATTGLQSGEPLAMGTSLRAPPIIAGPPSFQIPHHQSRPPLATVTWVCMPARRARDQEAPSTRAGPLQLIQVLLPHLRGCWSHRSRPHLAALSASCRIP